MMFNAQRMVSMSTFEALIKLRHYREIYPALTDDDLFVLISKLEIGGLDYASAQILDNFVPSSIDYRESTNFFRACIEAAVRQNDIWLRSVTFGRKKFVQKLDRDEVSCFRCARLLEDPPSMETIAWWDRLQASGRDTLSAAAMERARCAEKLSFDLEFKRLALSGICRVPIWMSIEDNTVGYDILSFESGPVDPVAKLVEVKSFHGQRRFYITRNEWNTALKFGPSYMFHIWDMQTITVYERSVQQVLPQIPRDGGDGGRWSEAIIQLI